MPTLGCFWSHMDVSKNRGKPSQNGWFIMETPFKMEDLGFETPLYSNFPNATLEINCLLRRGISPSVSLNLPVMRPAISCTTWHLGVPIFPMTQEEFTIVLDGEEICFSGMTHLGIVRKTHRFIRERSYQISNWSARFLETESSSVTWTR